MLINWLILIGFHALWLSWYTGLYPLNWLGLPDWASLVVCVAGWWLWAVLLGTAWWLCLALSLTTLNRLGRWGWFTVPFIWCWGLWLFEQLPVGMPWLSPGAMVGLLIPFMGFVPEALATGLVGLALTAYAQPRQQSGLKSYQFGQRKQLITAVLCGIALLAGVVPFVQPVINSNAKLTVINRQNPHWPVSFKLVQPGTAIALIRGSANQQLLAAHGIINTLSKDPAPAGTVWILPEEGALPGIVPLVQPNAQAIFSAYQKLASKRQWFMVVGATTQSPQSVIYNSVLLIQPHEAPQVVHKRRLVPFGETAPFGLDTLMESVAHYRPGFEAGSFGQSPFRLTFRQHNLVIWPLICSEALYPELWPPQGNNPEGVVVVGANLGWFQQRANPWLAYTWQHLLSYRSQQTGWPVISVANQGPTF